MSESPSFERTYHEERNKLYTEKLRALLEQLPGCCRPYFRSLETLTTPLTRYAYAIDLSGFFSYAFRFFPAFRSLDPASMQASDLDSVSVDDIEAYLSDMSLYEKDDRERSNAERAKARKLSTLRSFFKYLFRTGKVSKNVAELIPTPKIRDKAIIRLEPNEVADLLDHAESGDGLTERQKRFHELTKTRDTAILSLFLGTGIRISELVGLNIEHIDLENEAFLVTRKGAKEDILNFGPEVRSALEKYLQERISMKDVNEHERALFLSLQKKRITCRAVENLVKKYARIVSPLKRISPHKLRSTYGTMLYHETQDIYLVADVLGHKDVNTTKRHYAAASEEHKRQAARQIRLRDS